MAPTAAWAAGATAPPIPRASTALMPSPVREFRSFILFPFLLSARPTWPFTRFPGDMKEDRAGEWGKQEFRVINIVFMVPVRECRIRPL
ncbi:hypothetical protein TPA0909_37440 [Streptomyces albus]|nr:hypothetical protein TPA0909_37440 [Streptomyces albus]